ncbi:MAG: HAD family hydrolase [Phycisphaerales bacterium]|nr:HAD family hydrolase [Phycisphaerales bacterium]
MRRTIFLDRDNTIIHNDGHLGDPDAVHLMEGAAEAMIQLADAGYTLIVITNQSGVARGLFTEDDVKAVHQSVDRSIREATGREGVVLDWYYSPWHPEAVVDAYRGNHPTRKPEPGMLIKAAADHDIDLDNSWMVGDQERDVQAGAAAGCRSVRLASDPVETCAETCRPTLMDAARYILAEAAAS